MNLLTQFKNTTILPVLIALMLGCFGLLPQARAVCQEGCLTDQNTVLGDDALLNNTGMFNTAIGSNGLLNNTTGSYNTATGSNVLLNNTTGFYNTATGHAALVAKTTGSDNTAIGFEALLSNTTGTSNTAIGLLALWNNIGGSNNVALGNHALANNPTGNDNIAIGASSGSHVITGSNNIDIGNIGKHGDSGKIRIDMIPTHKDTSIAGISGATVPTGVAVLIDNSGHLGTTTSSARFKEAVKPMDKASETLFALRPVTFRYKHERDPDGIAQFGLVAEEVEKVNPHLVARDEQGKPYTVRYEAVNAMLLNEFLKEHRKVEQLEKQVATLAAGLQRVSAQLELSKSAPQVVKNP
jgi:Chaperone of endosialidase